MGAVATSSYATMASPGWIIVTGGNAGIGLETCKKLAALGYKVILTARDQAKGDAAVQSIRDTVPKAKIELMILDISDMNSVRKFERDFAATGKELAVLINNAGMATSFRDTTRYSVGPRNWEITMATNHLGTFLLTNLLIPHLRKYAKMHGAARVVVVASSMTERKTTKPFDVTDIMCEKPGAYVNGMDAYIHSKAANIMFTYELARRLKESGITVNCLCPGFIPATGLKRNQGTIMQWVMDYVIGGFIGKRIFKIPAETVDDGAERILDLAVRDSGRSVSGSYFKNGSLTVSSESTLNKEMQRQLWEASAKLTDLA